MRNWPRRRTSNGSEGPKQTARVLRLFPLLCICYRPGCLREFHSTASSSGPPAAGPTLRRADAGRSAPNQGRQSSFYEGGLVARARNIPTSVAPVERGSFDAGTFGSISPRCARPARGLVLACAGDSAVVPTGRLGARAGLSTCVWLLVICGLCAGVRKPAIFGAWWAGRGMRRVYTSRCPLRGRF